MLTDKMRRFCEEYVSNGYKRQEAYFAAFPDAHIKDTAIVNSYKLLKREDIRAYIKEIQHDRYEAMNINADRIAEEIAKMAFGDITELNTQSGKIKCLELLGKQLGLYTQKIDANVDGNITINVDVEE